MDKILSLLLLTTCFSFTVMASKHMLEDGANDLSRSTRRRITQEIRELPCLKEENDSANTPLTIEGNGTNLSVFRRIAQAGGCKDRCDAAEKLWFSEDETDREIARPYLRAVIATQD